VLGGAGTVGFGAVQAIKILNGKPKKVDEIGSGEFRYTSADNNSVTLNGSVHSLLSNSPSRFPQGTLFQIPNKNQFLVSLFAYRVTLRYMEPLIVIGIFLLGASAGSLLTRIQFRHEIRVTKAPSPKPATRKRQHRRLVVI
jgi:hypothetical protein